MSNNVPNLDAMSEDELMAFWNRFHRASRKDAEWLVGDRRKGFTLLAAALANYACNKAVAMKCRLNGNILGAQCYEHVAQLCYERLPEDLRW